MKKPLLAIVTLHPHNFGGVLALMKAAYVFGEQFFEPTLFFLGFDKEISAHLKGFKFSSSQRTTTYFGMRSVEIGARFAFWEPGHYAFTLSMWKEVLKDYHYCLVVSGTPIAAHPLLLLQKRFLIWVATPYQDDREQRVQQFSGVRWLLDCAAAWPMGRIEKKIVQKSSKVLALSRYAAQRLSTHNDNVALCEFPMDVPEIDQNKRKEKIIIAVGRFADPRKNFPLLVRTFDLIYKQYPDYKLYIVGQEPIDEDRIWASQYSCFRNIVFTGMIDDTVLQSWYKKASLMLISSYQEGLGIVGLEAMAYGIPVVSTDCGGPHDFVVDGYNGFLVPVNDHEAMAARVLEIIGSTTQGERMSVNARQIVAQNYARDSVYRKLQCAFVLVYPELKNRFEGVI